MVLQVALVSRNAWNAKNFHVPLCMASSLAGIETDKARTEDKPYVSRGDLGRESNPGDAYLLADSDRKTLDQRHTWMICQDPAIGPGLSWKRIAFHTSHRGFRLPAKS